MNCVPIYQRLFGALKKKMKKMAQIKIKSVKALKIIVKIAIKATIILKIATIQIMKKKKTMKEDLQLLTVFKLFKPYWTHLYNNLFIKNLKEFFCLL